MVKKKQADYLEVGIGAVIVAVTILDILPGDEFIGVPLGIGLIVDGMRWL